MPTPSETIAPIPPADFASWHPKLQRFYRYWQEIHPPHGLPGRRHLDPLAIADLLPGIWLLDIQPDPFRLRYRLVGTRVVDAIGREVTGQWVDEAHPHLTADPAFFERYRGVAEMGMPSRRRGKVKAWTPDDYREIENLAVPLASDGRMVDVIAVLTIFHYPDGTSN